MRRIGMMWSDPSKLPLSTKIREAVTYYQNKYGTIPTKIMVNPKDLENGIVEFAIETSRHIPRHNIWLGMEDK